MYFNVFFVDNWACQQIRIKKLLPIIQTGKARDICEIYMDQLYIKYGMFSCNNLVIGIWPLFKSRLWHNMDYSCSHDYHPFDHSGLTFTWRQFEQMLPFQMAILLVWLLQKLCYHKIFSFESGYYGRRFRNARNNEQNPKLWRKRKRISFKKALYQFFTMLYDIIDNIACYISSCYFLSFTILIKGFHLVFDIWIGIYWILLNTLPQFIYVSIAITIHIL